MKKKRTIACDKCGARIDHIPEKCPECGEIIYERMDPHLRGKIEYLLSLSPTLKREITGFVVFCTVVFSVNLMLAAGINNAVFPTVWVYFTLFVSCFLIAAAVLLALVDKSSWKKNIQWIFVSQIMLHMIYFPFILFFSLKGFGLLSVPRFHKDISFVLLPFLSVLFGIAVICVLPVSLGIILKKPVSYGWLGLYVFEGLFVLVIFIRLLLY